MKFHPPLNIKIFGQGCHSFIRNKAENAYYLLWTKNEQDPATLCITAQYKQKVWSSYPMNQGWIRDKMYLTGFPL